MAWLPDSHYENFEGMWPLLVRCSDEQTEPVEVADQEATEVWLDAHSVASHAGGFFNFEVYTIDPPGEDPPEEEEG
jgi:hypothetical protein